MAKRIFDIVVSATGLLVLGIPILLLAVVVKLTSPGPGIFRQIRVGYRRQPFVCYKLRTMYTHTPAAATHEVHQYHVTGVGQWLRRFKLDELPQLWNVLVGDMSLVGPRPCLPMQVELIAKRQQYNVFSIRPGISGKAQVQGIDMSDPERLAIIDAEYISERSFLGDLVLLAQTFSGKGRGDRVRA